jgi:hypothetical protein
MVAINSAARRGRMVGSELNTAQLNIKVAPSLRKALENEADALGLALGNYCRSLLAGKMNRPNSFNH